MLQGPQIEKNGNRYAKKFHSIESDGLPMISSKVTKGDIICCKYEPIYKDEKVDTKNSEN